MYKTFKMQFFQQDKNNRSWWYYHKLSDEPCLKLYYDNLQTPRNVSVKSRSYYTIIHTMAEAWESWRLRSQCSTNFLACGAEMAAWRENVQVSRISTTKKCNFIQLLGDLVRRQVYRPGHCWGFTSLDPLPVGSTNFATLPASPPDALHQTVTMHYDSLQSVLCICQTVNRCPFGKFQCR